MLTTFDHAARARAPRRPARSLKQEYDEFLFQRIEEFKNRLTRAQLLEIGDEAVRELETAAADQYLLTEVLLLEHVDRLIARRLRLPGFQRWAKSHRTLRAAQREPTHWSLERGTQLVACARRLEPGDVTVVVGAAALPHALFVAAHDVDVLLLDQDLGAIEAAEGRAVNEQLAGRFQALVVQLGAWLPDVPVTVAVLDPGTLAALDAAERHTAIAGLQARTAPGGVHIVLPFAENLAAGVIPIAPEALLTEYAGWEIQRRPRSRRGGFAATRLPRQSDTQVNVSE